MEKLFYYILDLNINEKDKVLHSLEQIMSAQNQLQCKKAEIEPWYNQFQKYNSWNDISRQLHIYETIWDDIKPKIVVSRAYFKLSEIIIYFKIDKIIPKNSVSLHLCEAPGGFAQASAELLGSKKCISVSKFCDIRFHKFIKNNSQTFKMIYEDILKSSTNFYKSSKYHFITADGAFDISENYDNQERDSDQLITAEIRRALVCQSKGGVFVLKIFDITLIETWCNIFWLKKCYKSIYLVKPPSSRPANSEKYIVCLDYVSSALKPKMEEIIDNIPNRFILETITFQYLNICEVLENIKYHQESRKNNRLKSQELGLSEYKRQFGVLWCK